MREDVPDRRPSAFGLHGAFGLVCSRCNAPSKAGGEFPAVILDHLGGLVATWERRVVKRWRRDQLVRGNGRGLNGGVDGCSLDGPDEKIPVFWHGS